MRVGFQARSLARFRGGVDLYVHHLLRHLAPMALNDGHTLCALFDDRRVAEEFRSAGVDVDVVGRRGMGRMIWDHVVTPAWCRLRRVDVIICPRSFRPLMLPCRSVTLLYDLLYFDARDKLPWWDHTYFRTVHRFSLRRSDAIVVFSSFTASRLLDLFPSLKPRDVHRLPPGPPHEAFFGDMDVETMKGRCCVPEPFVLVVGARPWKNVERILRAFATISGEVDHFLVVASAWERSRERLGSLASALGIAGRVVLLGRVDLRQLSNLYRRASLLVYVSLYEGIGMPPLEAMASDCPVVASTAGAIPETTADAALLVDPLDIDSIADGVLRALKDRALARELRGRGRRRVAQFDWDRAAGGLLELITSLS